MKKLSQAVKYLKSRSRVIQTLLVMGILVSAIAAVTLPKAAHAGNPSDTTPSGGTQSQEQTLTEQNQATLDKNQPAPQLQTSLERENLIKKLNFTNNANQLGYVYLMSLDGKVVANYTIKGKVSSLNSLLTTPQQIKDCSGARSCNNVVDGPDLDGSYGQNPSGIFFFTTNGAYVEWSGTYVYSSQPLNIQTAVSLSETVK